MAFINSPFAVTPRLLLLGLLLSSLLAANQASAFPVRVSPTNAEGHVAAASADLQISTDVIADDFRLGAYHFGLVNRGPDVAQNTVFRFPVPEGAAFLQLVTQTRLTTTLPPILGKGEIIISVGDLAVDQMVVISISLKITAPPGTKILAQASLSSDADDPHPENNLSSQERIVPEFPTIDSVKVLKNPFRIEIVGKNLLVPQFGRSGIGVGCDCAPWPDELTHRDVLGSRVILEGATELKTRLPKGATLQICYLDPIREMIIKSNVTR